MMQEGRACKKVGIVGGGQLGLMLCQAAQKLQVETVVLDKLAKAPAGLACTQYIRTLGGSGLSASPDDLEARRKSYELLFLSQPDVVTVETEHVDTGLLSSLSAKFGIPVHPNPFWIAKIQDKWAQKCWLKQNGFPVGPCEDLEMYLKRASKGPVYVKAKKGGYDGYGQTYCPTPEAFEAFMNTLKLDDIQHYYVEERISFEREVALSLLFAPDGSYHYPVVHTVQVRQQCGLVLAPAPGLSYSDVLKPLHELCASILVKMDQEAPIGGGHFTFECFLVENEDGSMQALVNEIAPRVHNSGHWTLDSSLVKMSQFEGHLRSILKLPFRSAASSILSAFDLSDKKAPTMRAGLCQDWEDMYRVGMTQPCLMANIVGGEGETMKALLARCELWQAQHPSASLMWYGKEEVRPARKMGHMNVASQEMWSTFLLKLEPLMREVLASATTAPSIPSGYFKMEASLRQKSWQGPFHAVAPRFSLAFNLPELKLNTLDALVGVVMGSDSDWSTLYPAMTLLAQLGIPFEATIVSAHRTPQRLIEYGQAAYKRGLKAIIAGAGGAAHLPGMLAAVAPLTPIIGVPVYALKMKEGSLKLAGGSPLLGLDALLSIVQMPPGVPVATVGVGNATNAALLAARILSQTVPIPGLVQYQADMESTVFDKIHSLPPH